MRKVRETRKVREVFHLKIREVSIPIERGNNFGFQSSVRPAKSFLLLSHEGLDLIKGQLNSE